MPNILNADSTSDGYLRLIKLIPMMQDSYKFKVKNNNDLELSRK